MREIGSEFDFDSNNKFINPAINESFFKVAELFRSGRDALRAIAIKYKGLYKRIVLPALCCESMVIPFQTNGYEIIYYKLNRDLTASIGDILSKLEFADIFLYMNYFGIQSLNDKNLQSIRERFPNVILIEDKTHDIFSDKCNDVIPDFVVVSIRKWLAIPDGGILYSQADQGVFPKKLDTFFGDVRTEAMKNKSDYLKSGDACLKELFRRQLAEANSYLDSDAAVVGLSSGSDKLLRNISFKEIARVRRNNTLILSQLLKDVVGIKQLSSFEPNKVSLYYPVLVGDRDKLQKALADKKIYCPVIWPLPKHAEGVCKVSDYVANRMLALPCDQRYGVYEMQHISSNLKSILGEED